jgi:outer membrane lipoprotein carrier protein
MLFFLRLGLAFVSLLGSGFPGLADESVTVDALVKKFETAYRPARTLKASFLEQYFDNGKQLRAEAGEAYFLKPGKMRWEYQYPEANLFVVDGKWSWFYVPADHTVTRIRANASSDARTPLALLAGEMKVSRVCKRVTLDPADRPQNSEGVVLRCQLRGEEGERAKPAGEQDRVSAPEARAVSYALFELNRVNGELLRVVVIDPGGTRVEFQFRDWVFDPHLDATQFRFVAPVGVAIVDGLN